MAKGRITEIDLLRTVAIILMVIYHTAYDLYTFYDWHINLWGESWQTFRIITASLFLILSGIATNFSSKPLRRALIVLACAVLISITTYLYDPTTFIYFGILHCIGLGMLLLIPLKKLRELNILIGIAILTLIPQIPAPLPTLDYYPIIPWIGLMMIGSGIGYYLYIRNNLRLPITYHLSLITLPGRHALLIYVLHQPIILATLALLYSR
ncbi:MAG: heparan-alpha-glucosaminide N-acetyltransferase [Candidatus Peribacteraceae bacterium]|nr:hypothetical protein [bacterium]MDP6561976.1 heparan-alpha-glucosaminide N-acetyltransferase [Candidatus Peribacteraceae bacterium]